MADELLMPPNGPVLGFPGDYAPEAPVPNPGIAPDQDALPEDPLAARMTGWLLEEPNTKKVAQKIIQERRDQEPAMKDRRTKWKAYRWIRQGKRFVRLAQDVDRVRVYAPPQGAATPPVPNLCDSLMRKTVATIFVDPFHPDSQPVSGADEDRESAELSERLIEHFGSDRQIDLNDVLEDALDKAGTYCTGFVYAEVTPNGRMEPETVMAHPLATDPSAPLVNPMTGLEDAAPVLKYVQLDGTLSEDAVNAKRVWTPDVDLCTLTGHHVVFLPAAIRHPHEANGVILCTPMQLSALMAITPEVTWTEEQKRKVAEWRPEGWEDTLPLSVKPDVAKLKTDGSGKVSDDTLCFPLKCYIRETADYENGAYVLVAADDVLYRGPWGGVAVGRDGKESWVTFPLPVVSVRWRDDHKGDDPYGESDVATLGPMDEILATQIGAILQYSDRFNKPREYLPIGSIVQPEQMRKRDGRPIFFNAEAGQPNVEQVPPLPSALTWLVDYMTAQMQNESLTPSAQGMSTPSVRSAKQDFALAERSMANISSIKRNVEAAYEQLAKLILTYYSVYCTSAQRVRYVGSDGQYKDMAWSRADIRGNTDIRVRRGSGTGLPMSAKLELARSELEIGIKVQDPLAYVRYQNTLSGRLDPILGLQQDRTMQRVRGQIAQWKEGPSEQALAMGDQGVLQEAMGIFQPLPVDDDPLRARVRYAELSNAMETDAFRRWATQPAWQQGYVQAWQQAKFASGILTIPEQQQMQQQQMQQQQMQQMQQQQQERSEGEESPDPNPQAE